MLVLDDGGSVSALLEHDRLHTVARAHLKPLKHRYVKKSSVGVRDGVDMPIHQLQPRYGYCRRIVIFD